VPPYRQVLDEIAETGFHGTELGSAGYLPTDPLALRNELHSRALQLVGAFFPIPLHAEDAGRSALEEGVRLARFLKASGCDTLVAAEAGDERRRDAAGRVSAVDALPASAWAHAGRTLGELATRCAGEGVRVVFHPHAGTYVETEAELDAVMAEAPDDLVGLCLDTGHVAYGGGDPVETARQYAGRVWHVHVKDVSALHLQRVRDENVPYAQAVGEGVFVPLGQGSVDFPGLVDALSQQRYPGWWVLEQDVRLGPPWPEQDPKRNAAVSLDYLRGLLDQHYSATGGGDS
jgi:inosose dehydratase